VQTNASRVHEPVQKGDNSTANAYLSQMLENGLPSVIDHRLGRYRQAPAAPGLVRNAGGGVVVEFNMSKIFVLKDEGCNATKTGHGNFVSVLFRFSAKKKQNKTPTAPHQTKTSPAHNNNAHCKRQLHNSQVAASERSNCTSVPLPKN
jgi:hypothetical protein